MLRIEITKSFKNDTKSWVRKTLKKDYEGLIILLITPNSIIYDSDNIIYKKHITFESN